MVTGLERFDEVLAELEDLPSPYYLRMQELRCLAAEQLADKMRTALDRISKHNIYGPRIVDYIEMSFVVTPSDPSTVVVQP